MDDWDSVTKIGKNVRRGGAAPRETVLRGNAAINAAQRSGSILGTEKKYVTGNRVGKTDGQKDARVDRETDVGKLDSFPKEVAQAMSDARKEKDNMSRVQFADKTSIPKDMIQKWETGAKGAKMPTPQEWDRMERVLGIKLRGKDLGKPKFPNKKA